MTLWHSEPSEHPRNSEPSSQDTQERPQTSPRLLFLVPEMTGWTDNKTHQGNLCTLTDTTAEFIQLELGYAGLAAVKTLSSGHPDRGRTSLYVNCGLKSVEGLAVEALDTMKSKLGTQVDIDLTADPRNLPQIVARIGKAYDLSDSALVIAASREFVLGANATRKQRGKSSELFVGQSIKPGRAVRFESEDYDSPL